MTERELVKLLGVWKSRLGLDNWQIEMSIGGCESDCSYAETHRSTTYENAHIYFQPWMLGKADVPADLIIKQVSDYDIEKTLVHELLHLHTRDMHGVTVDDTDGLLHRDVHEQLRNSFRRAEEQMVDRLAVALVKNWGG